MTTDPDTETPPDLPVVTRDGDRISMSLHDWDEFVARLLVAEGHVERSWLRP